MITWKLKELMREKGYTCKALADACGLPLVFILSVYSREIPGVQFKELDALCHALQCTPGDLLNYTREK